MSTPALRADMLSKRFEVHQERRYTFKERFVRGRAKGYREFWALRDVSFEVKKGSFFGIIGHNGSGKSTALKILAGIYRPTSGNVTVNGRLRALLELGAGFNPELTGRENIQLNGAILGLTQREITKSMDAIVEFAGIGDFIDAPVKVYSSGMGVRLGFAVAVKLNPEILIVDEVIAVGDEKFQRQCNDYMFDLRRKGRTIVMVTHATGLVEDMCDEVMWLDGGRCRAVGRAPEVVHDYLTAVNRAEAGATATIVGDAEVIRRGSGEVRVAGVEYLDFANTAKQVVLAGQPIRIRVNYTVETATDAMVGLMFHTETGVYLAGPTSRDQGPFRFEPGAGHADFDVPELLLQPGTYLVTTVIAYGGHFVDLLERAFVMKVRGDGSEDTGVVRLPGKWTQSAGVSPGRARHLSAGIGPADAQEG